LERRVLVVDDDVSVNEALKGFLEYGGYDVSCASTGKDAAEQVTRQSIGVVLLDLRLRKESGLDLLPVLKSIRPEISVIIITAVGTIETAVEAMRLGADNFVSKPIDPKTLLAIVSKGFESRALRVQNLRLERLHAPVFQPLWGQAAAIQQALNLADAVAQRDTSVLLHGETGTGKGFIARRIHDQSPRKSSPFVQLNCAGLQKELTESELFGHERGAFTGAVERKIGLFEAADGGTLLLDEIGEMELGIQAKLLKVLDEKVLRRVGGVSEINTDVRVIAATHRDLSQQVTDGNFREDLFYRLNVFVIEIPPLYCRKEDIIPLASHFLNEFRDKNHCRTFSKEAEELLLSHRWPGNIRELRNAIERAAIICPPESTVLPCHLPPFAVAQSESRPTTAADADRQALEKALQDQHGNLRAAARQLGVSPGTLYRKIKKHRLSVGRNDAAE
jgi:DNA-binding NtrC family response regulator